MLMMVLTTTALLTAKVQSATAADATTTTTAATSRRFCGAMISHHGNPFGASRRYQRQKRRWPRRRRNLNMSNNFHWDASVDVDTGLASSIEQSGPSSINTTINGKISARGDGDENRFLSSKLQREFIASWPEFVCRGDVSFGLFRIVDTTATMIETKKKQQKTGKEVILCLQPRFIPITLLKFGQVKVNYGTKSKATSAIGGLRRVYSYSRNRRNDSYEIDEQEDIHHSTRMMSWEIPIMGGILALPSSPRRSQRKMNHKKLHKKSKSEATTWGKLVFNVDKITCRPSRRPPLLSSATTTKSTVSSTSNDIKNRKKYFRYNLTTQIVGYRPRLVGYPPITRQPNQHQSDKTNNDGNFVSFIGTGRRITFPARKWFYLHSQSYVHAYVTWRFHKSWHDRLLQVQQQQKQ